MTISQIILRNYGNHNFPELDNITYFLSKFKVKLLPISVIGLEYGGIDLETYGIAGVSSFPFIVAIITRVVKGCTKTPTAGEEMPELDPTGD